MKRLSRREFAKTVAAAVAAVPLARLPQNGSAPAAEQAPAPEVPKPPGMDRPLTPERKLQLQPTKGSEPMGKPVTHFEIGCRDIARTQEFYGKLFDWKMAAMGPAAMIDTGAGKGIQGHITALGHEPHNYVTVYVEVDDLAGYLAKAQSLGGKSLVPPVEIPGGGGSFAWMADPEGNLVGLFKPPKT